MKIFRTKSSRINRIVETSIIAIASAFVGVMIYSMAFSSNNIIRSDNTIDSNKVLCKYQLKGADSIIGGNAFVYAADKSVDAVVHVKTSAVVNRTYHNPLYEFFYGRPMQKPEKIEGIGSGVIVSEDGYIVTNNHVISKSDEIEITLNDKRKFDAELVGADPSTDIALLKIDAQGLEYIPYGNSDNIKVGEWVLAIGNPFNLTSTVTAGIISAKTRNLGILDDKYRIESFIQTDAALNQGNSGGALVNLKGELVGVNTAILSPSGAYSGNSFAVPVNIVKKVVADLIEFGEVQRALLGVTIRDITADLAEEKDIDKLEGVYVEDIAEGGAADEAGIEAGDIILEIDGDKVDNAAEIQEKVSEYRPGDKIKVKISRDGKVKTLSATLKNLYGSEEYIKPDQKIELYGAEFQEVPSDLKKKLDINNGVQIVDLGEGKFMSAGIKEGFVIVKINNNTIKSLSELKGVIKGIDGGVYIEGLYPNGVVAYYAFGLKK